MKTAELLCTLNGATGVLYPKVPRRAVSLVKVDIEDLRYPQLIITGWINAVWAPHVSGRQAALGFFCLN